MAPTESDVPRTAGKQRMLVGAVLLGLAYGFAAYLALFAATFALVVAVNLDIAIAAFTLATALWVLPLAGAGRQVRRELAKSNPPPAVMPAAH